MAIQRFRIASARRVALRPDRYAGQQGVKVIEYSDPDGSRHKFSIAEMTLVGYAHGRSMRDAVTHYIAQDRLERRALGLPRRKRPHPRTRAARLSIRAEKARRSRVARRQDRDSVGRFK